MRPLGRVGGNVASPARADVSMALLTQIEEHGVEDRQVLKPDAVSWIISKCSPSMRERFSYHTSDAVGQQIPAPIRRPVPPEIRYGGRARTT